MSFAFDFQIEFQFQNVSKAQRTKGRSSLCWIGNFTLARLPNKSSKWHASKSQIKIDLYFVNVFRKTLYVSFLWIIGYYIRSVENEDQSNWRWKSYYIHNALWDTTGSSKLSFRNTYKGKCLCMFFTKVQSFFLTLNVHEK